MKITDCFEKRVLVRVGGKHHVHVSVPWCLSPNGEYVRFLAIAHADDELGWQYVDEVEVLEVLGPAEEAPAELYRRLKA